MEKQIKFDVIKEKIIKTDELIRLFKQKTDDFQRISLVNKQYKTKLELRKNEINRLKLENNVLTTRSKNTDNTYKILFDEHQDLKNRYNELEQEYFTKINDQQTKFQTVSQELVECREKLIQYEKLQDHVPTPKKPSKSQNNQLNNELNGLKLQHSVLDQEFKDLQQQYGLVVEALKKTELQVNRQTAKKDDLKCNKQTCTFFKELASLQLDNDNLRKQISDSKNLEDSLAALKKLKQQHDEVQNELSSIKLEHEEKINKISNLKLKLEQYELENNELKLVQHDNDDKSKKIGLLLKEIELLKNEKLNLTKDNNDMKEKIIQLTNQIRELNDTPSDIIIDDIMKEMSLTDILTPFNSDLEDNQEIDKQTTLPTTSGDFVVSNVNENITKLCGNSRNIIRQRKRKKLRNRSSNVDLLATLKVLTESNIKFTLSNESLLTRFSDDNRDSYHFSLQNRTKLERQEINENKTDYIKKKLYCNLECCNKFATYCIMKNDNSLLGFLNVKNEENSKFENLRNDKLITSKETTQVSENNAFERSDCTLRRSKRLSNLKNKLQENANPFRINIEVPNSQTNEEECYSPIVKKKRISHARMNEHDDSIKKTSSGKKIDASMGVELENTSTEENCIDITKNSSTPRDQRTNKGPITEHKVGMSQKTNKSGSIPTRRSLRLSGVSVGERDSFEKNLDEEKSTEIEKSQDTNDRTVSPLNKQKDDRIHNNRKQSDSEDKATLNIGVRRRSLRLADGNNFCEEPSQENVQTGCDNETILSQETTIKDQQIEQNSTEIPKTGKQCVNLSDLFGDDETCSKISNDCNQQSPQSIDQEAEKYQGKEQPHNITVDTDTATLVQIGDNSCREFEDNSSSDEEMLMTSSESDNSDHGEEKLENKSKTNFKRSVRRSLRLSKLFDNESSCEELEQESTSQGNLLAVPMEISTTDSSSEDYHKEESNKRFVSNKRPSPILSNSVNNEENCVKPETKPSYENSSVKDLNPEISQLIQGAKRRIAHHKKEHKNNNIGNNVSLRTDSSQLICTENPATDLEKPIKFGIRQNIDKQNKSSFKRPVCRQKSPRLSNRCNNEDSYKTSENSIIDGNNIDSREVNQETENIVECRKDSKNDADDDDMNPQSPPMVDQGVINCNNLPKIIPLEKIKKMESSKVMVLLQKLILYSSEEKASEEIVQQFTNQDPEYIARIVLDKIIADRHNKPDSKYTPPAPLLTEIQRILLGFLVALVRNNVDIYDKFLALSEQNLYFNTDLDEILAITRFYLSVCKLQHDIHRIRKLCCEMFYFNYNYAVPFFFVVLTSWTEVLPFEIESKGIPLARILVQNVYISNCNQPGYNLLPLRDLLIKYYGYPTERWNSDELFDELFNNYRNNPIRSSDFNLLLLCRNHPDKWVYEQIHKYLIPLIDQISIDNFKAAVIILIGNLCYNFSTNTEYLTNIREWMNNLITDTTPDIVQRSICLSLNRLTREKKKKS